MIRAGRSCPAPGSVALVVIVIAGALACEAKPAPGNDTQASQAGQTEAPELAPDPAKPTPKPNSFQALSADALAQTRAALQTHLAAGREALEAGDFGAGITALEQAVALNPMDGETLAALGGAYFDAGRLDDAQASLERGLHHARDDPNRRAILAALGRIAEAQGQRELAAELYQRSLLVGEDQAVAEHLAVMTGGYEVVSHSACTWTARGPAPIHLCHAFVGAAQPGSSDCEYDPIRPLTATELGPGGAAPAGASGQATVPALTLATGEAVSVFSVHDPARARERVLVNVVTKTGVWHTAELDWLDHPEVTYADESLVSIELRAEQLSEGGKPEIAIEWEVEGRAMNESYRRKRLAVLTVEGSEPRWLLGLETESRWAPSAAGAGTANDNDPIPVKAAIELAFTTKTGELEVLRTKHEASAPVGKFALGTYPKLCPAEID